MLPAVIRMKSGRPAAQYPVEGPKALWCGMDRACKGESGKDKIAKAALTQQKTEKTRW